MAPWLTPGERRRRPDRKCDSSRACSASGVHHLGSLVLEHSPSQMVVQNSSQQQQLNAVILVQVVEIAGTSSLTPADRSSTASLSSSRLCCERRPRARDAAARVSGRGPGGCGLAHDLCSLCVAAESVAAAVCCDVCCIWKSSQSSE